EEVAAAKHVTGVALALLAEHRRDPGLLADDRHVAGLAALLLAKRAVLPLQIGHLLGKLSECFTLRTARLGVERVTGGAELGLADVRPFGRHERARRMHDARASL